ncbi:MAG: adenylyl-sulfate kinase [Polyangiaceae bacterium]|jgi:adenylyl-sulfate kinase|nr:adenylyl-sulfate kinase [Polyangiaceae bacterium]
MDATDLMVPTRSARERLLGQRAVVVWLTGLSGAGKTTLGTELIKRLHAMGRLSTLLDGDELRRGLNSGLGFSDQDRQENIRRIAEAARLLLETGVIVVVAAISPTLKMRDNARRIVGAQDFVEVHVRCPVEVCEKRDVKGLYRRARAGQVPQFTGVSAPYETPPAPDLVLDTALTPVTGSAQTLLDAVVGRTARGAGHRSNVL